MQTFLPHPEFDESAACLDYKRLGKQRLEAKTIIDILDGKAKRDSVAIFLGRIIRQSECGVAT